MSEEAFATGCSRITGMLYEWAEALENLADAVLDLPESVLEELELDYTPSEEDIAAGGYAYALAMAALTRYGDPLEFRIAEKYLGVFPALEEMTNQIIGSASTRRRG